ncbi:MAG: hypothetical protein JNK29_02520 [Anaerolineales bacterium]|nr:hypothetical protein [Anaerolineales bacterium]
MTTTSPAKIDQRALWAGIGFSFLFTALIAWLGGRLESIRLLPDSGVAWYYWRLPEPTVWTRLAAWGGYFLHQAFTWWTIWYAQSRPHKYTDGLHWINWVALFGNAGFIALHVLQTHLFYDGLAQDISIFLSQGSVIVLLIWVLLMENGRRGLVWGWKAPISPEVNRWARKTHGYIFVWAAVLTFWYHPAVSTPGHLIGFLYMFFLLLQGSLFFTRVHVNKWWTVALEVMVLVHGTLVAVGQGNGIWPMFFFGFGGLFVITQMHGLGLGLPVRLALLAGYVGGVLWVYNDRGWDKLNEIIRIPAIDYLGVAVLALLIGGGLGLARRLRGRRPAPSSAAAD